MGNIEKFQFEQHPESLSKLLRDKPVELLRQGAVFVLSSGDFPNITQDDYELLTEARDKGLPFAVVFKYEPTKDSNKLIPNNYANEYNIGQYSTFEKAQKIAEVCTDAINDRVRREGTTRD